ncbi:hypothetical protein FOMPIDRAFT_1063203 [Fomitopsis schrenkii]|uniref:Uncharacterized protein n=1 Tax=Fomitopsis schrenkii TaxID=2126942 RepID=S8DT22_FOMSC|nr:hypothetical protein FOMPIDRAFT_1063203 [Fomitopsis schrenkii]
MPRLRLPESIQLAVCQNGVQLEDFLYSIFWADGSWDFPDFEQSAQVILASQTKPISPCQNTTQSATSTSVSTTQSATSTSVSTTQSATSTSVPTMQTTTSTSAPTTSGGSQTPEAPVGGKVDVAAAIGGSLGGALGLVVLGAIVMILRYRKRLRAAPMNDSHDLSQIRVGSMYENIVTPFSGQYRAVSSSGNVPKGTPIPRTYDEEVLHPPGSYTVPTASVSEFERGEDSPVPLAPSAFGPGSQLHEHDAGVTLYADSHRHSSLPPEYRTVYSG